MGEAAASLMHRMTRPAAAPPPLTSARALRLAMARAAQGSVGLSLAVLGIREEEAPLDDLLGRVEDALLILALRDADEPAGLIALDSEARAAVIEAQALGRVGEAPAEARSPTAAADAMARPLLETFLEEAQAAIAETPLAGWLCEPRLADRLPGPREAALLLPDGMYRAVRLTLDLGAGGRQGLLLLLVRLPEPPRPAEIEATQATVAPLVMGATLSVEAVLHRLRLPYGEAESLRIGQVLPLPGITVASVRLIAGSHDLGAARLGQVAGMRAVWVEQGPDLQLGGLPVPGAVDPAPGSLPQSKEAPAWGPPEVTPMG